MDFRGINISTKNIKVPNDCKRIKDYLIKLAILISKENKEWNNYGKKCSPTAGRIFRTMMHSFPHLHNKDDLYKYLKGSFLKNRQIESIITIYKKKKSKKKNRLPLLFNTMISSIADKKNKAAIYKENIHYYQELEKEPDGLMKIIISTIIAIRGNNMVWAKEQIKTLLSQHPQKFIFSPGNIEFGNEHNFKRFKDNLLKGLLYIEKNLPDKELTKLLFSYMQIFLKEQEYTSVRIKIRPKWSLAQIREMVKSHHYGKKYPVLWYFVLNKRTYGTEDIQFLTEFLTEKNIKREGASYLWIYDHYLPTKAALRKAAFEQIEKVAQTKNDYNHYILLKLLEKHEAIHQRLKRKHKEYRGPLFKLKRKYYQELLSKGDMIHFSLYQLAKLGDKDQNFLWWIIL